MMAKPLWIALYLSLDQKVKCLKTYLGISRRQIIRFWPANVLSSLLASFEGCLQDDDLFYYRAGVLFKIITEKRPSILSRHLQKRL